MIKHINRQNVTLSPFIASKNWSLSNVKNDDLVILEPSGYANGTTVSVDYVDYLSGEPLLSRDCNIALEQQPDDIAVYEEGNSGSLYPYNPDNDEFNTDGSSKTLLYNQIAKSFYNDYRNPTEIFGMENIDFPLAITNRYLADSFRMFTIPRFVMGDKIKPGSVQFQDTAFDDNVRIQDDANGNLIAGDNLFSKIQEVRSLGNNITAGPVTMSYTCPVF